MSTRPAATRTDRPLSAAGSAWRDLVMAAVYVLLIVFVALLL
jgi:hypothetical protein